MSRASYTQTFIEIDDSRPIPLAGMEKLSTFRIIGICCAWFTFQIGYCVEYAILTPLMRILGFKPFLLGVMWFTGPIAGMFVQPLIGNWCDTARWKMGRRRPVMIGGLVISLMCFAVFMFIEEIHTNIKSEFLKALLVFTLMLLLNTALNAIQAPAHAIVGDLVPKKQQQRANNIGVVMTSIAAAATYFIGGLPYFYKNGYSFTRNYRVVIILGCSLMAICLFITVMVGREEQLTEIPARHNKFKEICLAFRAMPPILQKVSVVYLISWVAYYPLLVLTTQFFGSLITIKGHPEDNSKGIAFGTLVMAVSNIFVLIMGFFQECIREHVGIRGIYFLSQIFVAISLALYFFVRNEWVLMGTAPLLSFGSLTMNSVPYEIIAKTIPQEHMATYTGAVNAYAVFGQQISNLIFVILISSIKSDFPEATTIGSCSVVAIIAAVASLWLEEPKESDLSNIEESNDFRIFNRIPN